MKTYLLISRFKRLNRKEENVEEATLQRTALTYMSHIANANAVPAAKVQLKK
jgi:hypothetical protein